MKTEKLYCPGCGREIGRVVWVEDVREWRIVLGCVRLYHADGVCECGFHWHWTAGRRQGKRGIMRRKDDNRKLRKMANCRSLPPDCAQC